MFAFEWIDGVRSWHEVIRESDEWVPRNASHFFLVSGKVALTYQEKLVRFKKTDTYQKDHFWYEILRSYFAKDSSKGETNWDFMFNKWPVFCNFISFSGFVVLNPFVYFAISQTKNSSYFPKHKREKDVILKSTWQVSSKPNVYL